MKTLANSTDQVLMVRSLPAAARIHALLAAGLDDNEIRARGWLTRDQLRRAKSGRGIGWEVERRILDITVPAHLDLDGRVPGHGIRRRLQALLAIGWPARHLAWALGWTTDEVWAATTRFDNPRHIHFTVCALYSQRWNLLPEDWGVPAEETVDARRLAELEGWHSPLAWDDDKLDDITARPRPGAARSPIGYDMAAIIRILGGERELLTPTTFNSSATGPAVEYGIRRLGLHAETVASLLDMDLSTVKRSFERIKAKARKQGMRWPDQPRYTAMTAQERAAAS